MRDSASGHGTPIKKDGGRWPPSQHVAGTAAYGSEVRSRGDGALQRARVDDVGDTGLDAVDERQGQKLGVREDLGQRVALDRDVSRTKDQQDHLDPGHENHAVDLEGVVDARMRDPQLLGDRHHGSRRDEEPDPREAVRADREGDGVRVRLHVVPVDIAADVEQQDVEEPRRSLEGPHQEPRCGTALCRIAANNRGPTLIVIVMINSTNVMVCHSAVSFVALPLHRSSRSGLYYIK